MSNNKVLTPKQYEAYSKLIELGGENVWVESKHVGKKITINALEKMRIIQTKKIGKKNVVALTGCVIGEDVAEIGEVIQEVEEPPKEELVENEVEVEPVEEQDTPVATNPLSKLRKLKKLSTKE